MITLHINKHNCHPTSNVIASCCHDISNKIGITCSIKDYSIDYDLEKFVNSYRYGVWCTKCFLFYLVRGLVLFTDKQEDNWLRKE